MKINEENVGKDLLDSRTGNLFSPYCLRVHSFIHSFPKHELGA